MATSEFRLFNTMSKQKEVFKARVGGKVGMYVCGVTAYALSHLGHARAAVAFDVLYRYLQHLGYEVTYVRNFTDVDDKIIRRANEGNEISENPLDLSSHFCQEYLNDMADLQCLPPTHQPRVSDHMDQIKDMITQIINNDCAYTVDGDVYFSVDEFPNYGRLSGRKLEDNRAGERVAIDSRKHNPADFALWKAAKPGEPSWDSPWGPGRPGWHIECSAMSAHYLSSAFDIHGGGMDLIFPHHENEIAQSCAACQESKVSYWMHNGHVTNNNEKMSKSLGNFFTIREITELYHPLALRHFLMSAHYRSQVNYSISQLERASDSVFYIYQALQDCEDALSPFQEGGLKGKEPNGRPAQITPAAQGRINKLQSEFQTMMSDDLQMTPILNDALLGAFSFINSYLDMFKTLQECEDALSPFRQGGIEGKERNGRLAQITAAAQGCVNKLRSEFQIKMSDDLQTTPKLTDALLDALSFIDSYLGTLKKQQKQKQLSAIQSPTESMKGVEQVQNVLIQSLNEVVKEVKLVLNILGLLSTSTYSEVLQQLKDKALKRAGIREIDLLNLIEERSVARKNKDFAKADKMRSDLTAKGISLMDGVAMETTWRPCVPPQHQQQAQPTAASS